MDTATQGTNRFPFYDDDLAEGRTELNLCEFPVVVPYYIPADKPSHTISAPDRRDPATGQIITKQITIIPSLGNGYPTLFDDRVLTAMITLAHREHGFEKNRCPTNRYEIAKILQLDDGGKTYKRLFVSSERMSEVRYRSDNAWWDNGSKTRQQKDRFGLLDRVTWNEDRGGGRYSKKEREECFLVFGDKLYENLKSGFVRQIDFNIANRLSTFVGYRSYPLLMKRFYRSDYVDFSLDHYFNFHLGMSPNYNAGQKKSKLKKGMAEMEHLGIIAALPDSERYIKDKSNGGYRVVFRKENRTSVQVKKIDNQEAAAKDKQRELFADNPLVVELVKRGFSTKSANVCVKDFPEERIRHCMEVVDWRIDQGHKITKPAGLLFKTIVDEHEDPEGFESQQKKKTEAATKNRLLKEYARLNKEANDKPEAEKEEIRRRLRLVVRAVSDQGAMMHNIERKAVATFSDVLRGGYYSWRSQGMDERKMPYVIAYTEAVTAVLKEAGIPLETT